MLIVIGDGNDVVALVYKSAVSSNDQIIGALTTNVQTVNAAAGFSAAFAALWPRR